MAKMLKHLWLALALIASAAFLLLYSDWDRRVSSETGPTSPVPHDSPSQSLTGPLSGQHFTVAISYFVPAEVFDQGIQGFKDEMAEQGYIEGDNLTILLQHCNADMGMLTQVTQSLANKNPNVLVAFSTPCLGNAIAQSRGIPIVFGIVSAPIQAKAGTSYEDHLPHVTGAVDQIPSEYLYRWVKRVFPKAVRIGTLYNPSEANAVAEIEKLKRLYEKLGYELITLPVMNTAEIQQAAQSMVQKDIDLFLSMADNTVVTGLPSILKLCRERDIPVIADDQSMMGTGALMSCGPGPYWEGRHTAAICARILKGESPAHIPFEPSTKYPLHVDFEVAKALNVTIPDDMKQQVDHAYHVGVLRGRPAKVAVINLVNNAVLDAAVNGITLGLQGHGLQPDRDYVIKHYNAQGDLSLLTQLFDTAVQDDPDVIVSITTPAFIAGAHRIKTIPYVFCVASDPAQLGLFQQGKPDNLTGVHDNPALDKLLNIALDYDPTIDCVGIIYDTAQPQSAIAVKRLRQATQNRHITMLEGTASSISDLSMATQSVIQRGADAIVISTDNLANTGFDVIHKVAASHDIPIFVTDMPLIEKGAIGGIGDDYQDWGKQGAAQVAKILMGLSPRDIPIEPTTNAKIVIPTPKPVAVTEKPATPLEFRLVLYNETPFSEACAKGMLDGITRAGLIKGQDFNLRTLNAQGDMTTLSSIMTSVKSDQADLLLVISTPVLQAALRQAGTDTPIVFCGVGDAVKAGAGQSETDHYAHITGITTRSPFAGMARLIRETLPQAKAVGTLFTPAEINSELYRAWFEEALTEQEIRLIAIPVTASADTTQAAVALCQEPIAAIAQIVDNTTRPGFGQIARKAAQSNLPVYVFDSSQMQDGATLCLACDYYESGLEAAAKALEILHGANPKDIPFSNTQSEKLIVNSELARQYHLVISESLQNRAIPMP